jgi:hypothetical protein
LAWIPNAIERLDSKIEETFSRQLAHAILTCRQPSEWAMAQCEKKKMSKKGKDSSLE